VGTGEAPVWASAKRGRMSQRFSARGWLCSAQIFGDLPWRSAL